MERVLEVYQRPEDPRRPVVAMDERPVQLLEDIRSPVPVKPGRIAHIDYEYKRIAVVFCFPIYQPPSRLAAGLGPGTPHRHRLGGRSQIPFRRSLS